MMAEKAGLSHTTIWRIWGTYGLQPHRSETFKLSTDLQFVDKVRDIVGLYMSPPDRVLGKRYNRHRFREFPDFPKLVEKNVPKDLDIHLILDSHGTHKTGEVRKWIARRPHWHVHFTLTSSSWIN